MDNRKLSIYEVLKKLVVKELVGESLRLTFRIDGKPAYHYLSKSGVTAVHNRR